ncbi:tetratricopeptide repeat protein [Parabacteroides sp. APC149_11_2_Y6]
MKKEEISRLLQRYLSGRESGHDAYFDADEIDILLDSFEESDDFTYYDGVLALGLRLHPGNPDLQIRQCKSYVYNEDYESALTLIDSIAEKGNQELDMLRLECYVMQNTYDKVVEYTEQLIAADCEYLEVIFEYTAPILGDMEMTKEARDYINRGLMLFPDNLILKDELCYNLEVEGDFEHAIRICNELIDKNPYSYDYWFTLGRLYSMTADYEKAIEAFDFALTCDDSDDELKTLKAYCLYMNENYEKAIELYNEIVVDEDSRLRAAPLLAECYIKLDEFEKAYGILKELIDKRGDKEDASTYLSFIRCCAETDREEEGSRMLEEAYKLFPDNVRILSLMAISSLDENGESRAEELTNRLFDAIDKAEDTQSEDLDGLMQAGKYLYMQGDAERALKCYNKILKTNPGMPYLHLNMAMAYLMKGDMKHFGEHYRKTTPEEIMQYLKEAGADVDMLKRDMLGKQIPPEELASEFLKNKDNKN